MGSRDRSDRVNRDAKTNRDGSKNIRDGLTDAGRQARDRSPGGFNGADHLFQNRNGSGCSSCHVSEPDRSIRDRHRGW